MVVGFWCCWGGLVGLFFQESMVWVRVVWVSDGFFGVFVLEDDKGEQFT